MNLSHFRTFSSNSLYNQRLESLKEDLTVIYQRICADDLLKTMNQDPISLEFVAQRVKEIFEEVICTEREALLENSLKQVAKLTEKNQQLQEISANVRIFLIFR